MKGTLGGIDCSPNPVNGRNYLDIQPSLECDAEIDAEYASVSQKAWTGIIGWIVTAVVVFVIFTR